MEGELNFIPGQYESVAFPNCSFLQSDITVEDDSMEAGIVKGDPGLGRPFSFRLPLGEDLTFIGDQHELLAGE